MRKVKFIALFLAVVFLGDRLLSFAAVRVISHSKNGFVRMYEGKTPAPVVFLGNSRVDRNIDYVEFARLTGRYGLNLGLGGNHLLISEALLKDFVERYGNPELVVVELSSSIAEPTNIGEMQVFSYYSKNLEALARDMDPTYAAFQRVFNCLRFNSPTFWRLAVECVRAPSDRLLQNTLPPEIVERRKQAGEVKYPIWAKNLEALERICQFADARKIPLALMIAPYWKNFRDAIVNFDSWKAQLQAAAGQHLIHDYSRLFPEQNQYFNDEMHLNAKGASKFVFRLVEDKVVF